MTAWRRACEAGALVEAAPVRRGPTPAVTPKDAGHGPSASRGRPGIACKRPPSRGPHPRPSSLRGARCDGCRRPRRGACWTRCTSPASPTRRRPRCKRR
jgi:hypothetical protein